MELKTVPFAEHTLPLKSDIHLENKPIYPSEQKDLYFVDHIMAPQEGYLLRCKLIMELKVLHFAEHTHPAER